MENRVLFIVPPLSSDVGVKFINHQIPLGFLYMAGLLEKNGFKVKILDCPLYFKKTRKIDEKKIKIGLYPEQIEDVIREFKPNIVGISCSFSMFEQDTFEVIDLVKKIDKNIIVIVGGAHTSSNPEFVLRNKNIDLAVMGEGEKTTLEIAQRVKAGKSLKNIKGTALIVNNKIKINKPREYIENLDELDPAWHLIDFKKYFEHPDNYYLTMRKPSVNLITSRGCPGNCVFCSVRTIWGRKWRAMSIKKVVDQIEHLYKNHGIKQFRINDDNISIDKKRIIGICNEIIRRKINIKWDSPSGLAAWTLDEQVLDAMKKSGYYRVTFGIESGCKNTLKYIGKPIDLEKTKKLIDYCHKIGLWVASFFIIGFPYETQQDIKKTADYILSSNIDFPFIFLAQPYPGTKMYEDFKKEGLLKSGFVDTSTFILTKYHTKNLSPKQLNNMRRKIYNRFYLMKLTRYLNPFIFYKEFASKIKSTEDLIHIIRMLKNSLFVI